MTTVGWVGGWGVGVGVGRCWVRVGSVGVGDRGGGGDEGGVGGGEVGVGVGGYLESSAVIAEIYFMDLYLHRPTLTGTTIT